LTTAQGEFGTSRAAGGLSRNHFHSEKSAMTKSGLVGAAVLAAVIAAPAMAQEAMQEPGAYAQAHPWVSVYNYRYGRPGFWPGGVGPRVIAPAPLDDSDSYAYLLRHPTDDDYYATYYGDRPVTRMTTCGLQSNATYLGPDGRWYPC
jgi:hypothetical protein